LTNACNEICFDNFFQETAMKSKTFPTLLAFVIGTGIVLTGGMAAAQLGVPGTRAPVAPAGNALPELVTKVYPVADLVFTAPNYPFQGISVPGVTSKSELSESGAGGGGAGGFGGGGGGLHGGGFGGGGLGGGGGFNVPPESNPRLLPEHGGGAFSVTDGGAAGSIRPIDRLTQAIQTSIRPEMWSDHGGPGTIVALGDRLIITQTKEIQDAIRDLLTALRSSGGARSTVTVRAWWLRLDMSQYQQLLAEMPVSSPPQVNRKQLEKLAVDRAADYAEVTCFDGQTVHVISGRFRNAITSVIPVVGQAERPNSNGNEVQLAAIDLAVAKKTVFTALENDEGAQRSASEGSDLLLAAAGDAGGGAESPAKLPGGLTSEGVVGYQPLLTTQHAGAMLEITPTRLPDSKAIVLDLRSIVNRWDEKPESPVEFRNVVKLDRTNIVSQQLATTLKLPVRQPVLVGGMSLQPGTAADAEGKSQLYLVIEAMDETKAP
jgi:hypothetical protein